jgi:hypothetical protein
MPNHVHLLIEMQDDLVSRIMQRVLTGYRQYHNRKYKKIHGHGHGRTEGGVRLDFLDIWEFHTIASPAMPRKPNRTRPEDYEYSGHRAYLGRDRSGLVDAEPVLLHFGEQEARV